MARTSNFTATFNARDNTQGIDQVTERVAKAAKVEAKANATMARSARQAGKDLARMGTSAKATGTSLKAVGLDAQTVKANFLSMAKSAIGFAAIVTAVRGMASAFKDMVFETAKLGDELAKNSKRFGIAVEELDALRTVTELAGGSFKSLQTGLRTMAKNAVENTAAFKMWGIELEKTDGSVKSIEELFSEAADTIAALETETEQAAAAQAIFGRGGVELLPLLQQGSTAIDEQTAALIAHGEVMTTEGAEASEEFNDSMRELEQTWLSVKVALGEELLPVLTDLFKQLREGIRFVRQNSEEFKALARLILGPLTLGMSEAAIGAFKLNQAIKGTGDESEGTADGMVQDQKDVQSGLTETEKKYEAIRNKIAALRRESKKSTEGIVFDLNMMADNATRVLEQQARTALQGSIDANQAQIKSAADMLQRKADLFEKDVRFFEEQEAARAEKVAETNTAMLQSFQTAGQASQQAITALVGATIAGSEEQRKQAGLTAISVILGAAVKAAAEALAAHAGIPFIGPALGAVAAAAITAAILALQSDVPSAAFGGIVTGGSLNRDSVFAQVMPGELILPPKLARALIRTAGNQVGGAQPTPAVPLGNFGEAGTAATRTQVINNQIDVATVLPIGVERDRAARDIALSTAKMQSRGLIPRGGRRGF